MRTAIVIIIQGNHPEGPYAITFGNDYLKAVAESIENEKEFEEPKYAKPHLAVIEKDMLNVLPGISFTHYEGDKIAVAVTEILITLWKLSQSRKRLSFEEKVEFDWLLDLQSNYFSELRSNLAILQAEGKEDLSCKYNNLLNDVLSENVVLEADEINRLYGEDVQNATS